MGLGGPRGGATPSQDRGLVVLHVGTWFPAKGERLVDRDISPTSYPLSPPRFASQQTLGPLAGLTPLLQGWTGAALLVAQSPQPGGCIHLALQSSCVSPMHIQK